MPHYLLSICQPFTDGPYAEGKEHVGGIYVISAPDLEAALAGGS